MSDRSFFYDDISYVVSEAFREYFGSEIEFVERVTDYGTNGRFWLTFYLKKTGYTITFQSEKDLISILLKDKDGARVSLADMCVYSNSLSEESAISAVHTLKKLLDRYEPIFAEEHGKNVVLKARGLHRIVSSGEYHRMMHAHECRTLRGLDYVILAKHA